MVNIPPIKMVTEGWFMMVYEIVLPPLEKITNMLRLKK
jgi:hypothetical protein